MLDGERKSHLFSKHTQTNCKFEQEFKEAISVMGCVPWNMPYAQFTANETKICLKGEEQDFFDRLSAHSKTLDSCLQNCQSTSYSYNMRENTFDMSKECIKMETTLPQVSYMLDYLLRSKSKTFIYDWNPCKLLMSDSMVIHIKSDQTRVNVMHQYKRVSFASQLATIGMKTILCNIDKQHLF